MSKGETVMKVMVIIKATGESEAGIMPSHEELTKMGQFNEELVKAGILLAGEGLHPTSKGVRISFPEGAVTDGPFAETNEQLGGFYLIEARDLNDAIQVAARMPPLRFGCIEVRPLVALTPG